MWGGLLVNRKVILDTNLWSDLGNEGGLKELRIVLKELECTVLLPPSILVELLRNPHSESRKRHIDVIVGIRGRRLASEAQLCAEEFVRMVKRRRPYWMRSIADMGSVARYNKLWTQDWWRWAAEDSYRSHEVITSGVDVAPTIVAVQKSNRQAALQDNFASDYNHLIFSADRASAAAHLPGWDGQKVEAWRFDVASRYWHDMSTTRGSPHYDGMVQTMRDWVGARVDMNAAIGDPVDYWSLWMDEVTPDEVRRDWVRNATAYTQLMMKVGDGNARDAQHSAYLVDADLFLSSDRRLVKTFNQVREQALFPIAESRATDLQRGAVSAADAIRVALQFT